MPEPNSTVAEDSGPGNNVTLWIDQFKDGDDDALRRIWDYYFQRLVRYARRCFGDGRRRVVDEEDVALSAFEALAVGVADGRFEDLDDRGDLWQILVVLARRAYVDQVRRDASERRGGLDLRGESVFLDDDGTTAGKGLDQLIDDEFTPEFQVELDERFERLLSILPSDVERSVARMRLAGWSNPEIASRLSMPLRTIERRVAKIRDVWTRQLGRDDA